MLMMASSFSGTRLLQWALGAVAGWLRPFFCHAGLNPPSIPGRYADAFMPLHDRSARGLGLGPPLAAAGRRSDAGRKGPRSG